jgi:hypothetical protein
MKLFVNFDNVLPTDTQTPEKQEQSGRETGYFGGRKQEGQKAYGSSNETKMRCQIKGSVRVC